MADNENIADIKDIIVRVEGSMNILRNPNPNLILLDRKLQGIKDKANAMLRKANTKKPEDDLVQKIQEVKGANSRD